MRSMRGTGRGGASAFYGLHNQEVNMEARKLLWRMCQASDSHWIWYLLLICGLNTDSSDVHQFISFTMFTSNIYQFALNH